MTKSLDFVDNTTHVIFGSTRLSGSVPCNGFESSEYRGFLVRPLED